jgi:hypothetical protein
MKKMGLTCGRYFALIPAREITHNSIIAITVKEPAPNVTKAAVQPERGGISLWAGEFEAGDQRLVPMGISSSSLTQPGPAKG